ncbi:MAG TPA: hypothetical protein PLT92_14805 [Ignavibacteriaceae bacterium]|nr:hypothetical protein [Ignavibacteriaceae bacterium]
MPENVEYTIDLTATEEQLLLNIPEDDSISIGIITGDVIIDSEKYIEKSVINAKGDLIVGNINAEPARMPIGSPNYFMVVDPAQDRGYKFTNEIDGGTF